MAMNKRRNQNKTKSPSFVFLLEDFNVTFGCGDVQSCSLGVGVRHQGATSFQQRRGILQHDPLLLLPGFIHIYLCEADVNNVGMTKSF